MINELQSFRIECCSAQQIAPARCQQKSAEKYRAEGYFSICGLPPAFRTNLGIRKHSIRSKFKLSPERRLGQANDSGASKNGASLRQNSTIVYIPLLAFWKPLSLVSGLI